MGPISCPEKSIRNYHYPLRNNPEESSSQLLRGGNLKSGINILDKYHSGGGGMERVAVVIQFLDR